MQSVLARIRINHMQTMYNNLGINGNFRHALNAHLLLLALVRSVQLDRSPIKPKVFSSPDLWQAMEYAGKAESVELVVVTSAHSKS
jgi:hypothetical protein